MAVAGLAGNAEVQASCHSSILFVSLAKEEGSELGMWERGEKLKVCLKAYPAGTDPFWSQ